MWKSFWTLLQAVLLFGSQSQMLQLCDRCKTLIIKSVFTFFRFLLKQQPEEQQKINTWNPKIYLNSFCTWCDEGHRCFLVRCPSKHQILRQPEGRQNSHWANWWSSWMKHTAGHAGGTLPPLVDIRVCHMSLPFSLPVFSECREGNHLLFGLCIPLLGIHGNE